MKLYAVELSDSLIDHSYPDTGVYLTREAAERRAARMTYSDDCVEYWAHVVELDCRWDTDLLGPFLDYTVAHEFDAMDKQCEALKLELMWMRLARTKLQAENAKLRELVSNLYECKGRLNCNGCPYEREPCEFRQDMCDLGIEV